MGCFNDPGGLLDTTTEDRRGPRDPDPLPISRLKRAVAVVRLAASTDFEGLGSEKLVGGSSAPSLVTTADSTSPQGAHRDRPRST